VLLKIGIFRQFVKGLHHSSQHIIWYHVGRIVAGFHRVRSLATPPMPRRSVTPRRLFYSLGRQIQSRPNKGEPEFRCSARLVREGNYPEEASVGVNRRIGVTPDFLTLPLFYYCNYYYRIIITIVIIITVLLD